MRGKGRSAGRHYRHVRITPAYAGKRIDACDASNALWDHPRLCGEKFSSVVFLHVMPGSPPPMRGKVDDSIRKGFFQKDHPRLCGEKRAVYSPSSNGVGSPPPMRGKVRGKGPVCHRTQDHPRLCGEKVTAGSSWFRLAGSPPPMRGKEGGKLCAIIMPRITPAYAGKSYRSESTLHSRPDHPRLCGEKTMSSVFSTADTGSPPPMRGKEAKDRAKTFWGGITPAYAGKSFRSIVK